MRVTNALVDVAIVLMADPTGQHWGYELSKQSGVRSGVMYPLLSRLLNDGWVRDGWEERSAISEKRPPRRYYVLTERGRAELGAVIVQARRDPRFRPQFPLVPRTAGGLA